MSDINIYISNNYINNSKPVFSTDLISNLADVNKRSKGHCKKKFGKAYHVR